MSNKKTTNREIKMKMKVKIRVERLDNGIVFRWEDIDGMEDQKNLAFSDSDKESNVGKEFLDDIKCVMDANLTNMVEASIEYEPMFKTDKEEISVNNGDLEEIGLKENEKTSKSAWSEDDEQYLLVCKNALAKYQITDKWDAHIIFHWLENKLKSLRPQNHWKPSDKQIEALDFAADCIVPPEFCFKRKELKGLLEQLKKL